MIVANVTKKGRREGGAETGEGAEEDDDDKDWMNKECRNMRIRADWSIRSKKKLLKCTEDGYKI